MTPPVPPIPAGPGFVAGRSAPLRSRRCVRHSAREAAGLCSVCGAAFCRECLTEHDHRLVCAGCLPKSDAAAKPRRGAGLRRMRRAAGVLAAAVFLLTAFYLFGATLVKIPPTFHDGTIWQPDGERGER